jgi:small-conductance mechanosensitive channel
MIFIITDLFPFTRHWRYQVVNLLRVSLSTTLLTLGDREITIIGFLLFIIFFGGLFISTGILTNLLRTRILQVTRINRGAQEVISVIIRYCLLFFGTIVLLQFFGVNLSSLAIIGSAFGVGIGFGFQDIAKNFASGIVLLFERSIQVGDFIQVDDHMGTVERVGARSIVLKTLDRISIIVPNSRLLADEVINWSHGNPASRIHIPIGVAYGSDAQKVKSALLQAASEHPEVLRYPQPQVFFTSFGDSSLDFELLVWTSDPSRQQPLISDLYFQIEKIFRQQEIQIPFPQRDLHLRTGNLPVTLSPQFENYLAKLLNNLTAQRFQNSKPSNSSKKLN